MSGAPLTRHEVPTRTASDGVRGDDDGDAREVLELHEVHDLRHARYRGEA